MAGPPSSSRNRGGRLLQEHLEMGTYSHSHTRHQKLRLAKTKACLSQGAGDHGHLLAREQWTSQDASCSSLPRDRALLDAWGADLSKRGGVGENAAAGPQPLPSCPPQLEPELEGLLPIVTQPESSPGRASVAVRVRFRSSGSTVWVFYSSPTPTSISLWKFSYRDKLKE